MRASGRQSHDHDFDRLSVEISRLGTVLGEVIREIEGTAVFETVERLRVLAKQARGGEVGKVAELAREVGTLETHDAYEVAMAFTTYFELVNLAEENYRIHLLRGRRAAARQPEAPPMRETIDAALAEMRSRGVPAAEVQRIVDTLHIELVLTAHPTEAKRRTMLAKLARLARLLRHASAPAEHRIGANDPKDVHREIASLWLTDRSRTARPEVLDEVRTALWYFDVSLYETVPLLERELGQALATHYPGVKAPAGWLTFGSWVGGDRDGNPNVTPMVTAQTLALHRRLAITKLSEAAHEVSRLVTVSTRRDRVSPKLLELIRSDKDLSEHTAALAERYPNEPYRLLLAGLRARLAVAYEVASSRLFLRQGNAAGSALQGRDILQAVDTALESLRAGRGRALAGGDLGTLRRQVAAFGLHLARLDIRQHSSRHEAAAAELLQRAGVPDYLGLDEAGRRQCLATVLAKGGPALRELRGPAGSLSDDTENVLGPIEVLGRARQLCGAEVAGVYVISMAHSLSDVLEVLLFLGCTETSLPIAPLFETLDDLVRAPEVLSDMFANPAYRAHVAGQGNHQYVMLGYSDSNKDCGYLSANWALFQAQETVTQACEKAGIKVTLFHGRGGSIARGGGPAARAILAQPCGLRDGSIRITEQGEVLSTRYHDRDLAFRILEQMTYGVLLGAVAARSSEPLPAVWRAAMDEMSRAGVEAYRRLVHEDPDFLTFWQNATPIEEISALNLGSRPAFRRATKSVEDLRAIPWVFSWMQSRFNFPGWYGLGTALEHGLRMPHGEVLLREMYRRWPFFTTLVDNAQLTLVKADMGIAALYAGLVRQEELRNRIFGILKAEFDRTVAAILLVTGQKELLENEPVLLQSVRLRNPYIDPLNFVQVEMIRRLRFQQANTGGDEHAIRAVIELTINGISHGLKNTG